MSTLLSLLELAAVQFYKDAGTELRQSVIAGMYDSRHELEDWAAQMIARDCPTGDLELIRIENGAKREPGDGLDRRDVNLVFVYGRIITLEDLNREAENGFRTTLRQAA